MLCIAQKLRRLEKRFKTFQNRDYTGRKQTSH